MFTLLILLAILGIFSGIFVFYREKFLEKTDHIDTPLVSIIIPARNEEKNIKKILENLKDCNYPNLEIIVVDDNSIDLTSQISRSFGVKVIRIVESEEGFLGKPYACLKGFENSHGDILIFVDADVELEKDAIGSIVKEVLEKNAVVSVWPKHIVKEPYENLSMIFAIISAMASKSFTIFENTKPIGIYGPLIAVSRENYIKAGTHYVVKNEVVEDFKLGQAFLKANIPIINFLGGDLVKFRMYPDGLNSLFKGWAKNSALGSSAVDFSIVIPILLFLLGSLIPPLYYNISPFFYLYIAYVVLIRIFAKRVGEFSIISAILYPLIVLFTLFVITYSFYATFIRGFVEWKDVKIFTRR
ncbi:glycosyltransferase [Caldisericum exile]|uniref:glycosyltransferase n=1 Tax=Caldisericum exile TaxID=693075 RepID=UPI003C73E6E4